MQQLKTDDVIKYEAGEMTREEEVSFFQKLIDTGMAWKLQGHYGRNAERLRREALCTPRYPDSLAEGFLAGKVR